MEKCSIQGAGIDLPIDLIENPEIFSYVLSLDTWKHVLTPENRNHLKNYLPILPTDYPHAQEENLRALFDEKNFKFGNPLQTFRRKLQAGHYASDIVKYRRRCKTAKLKEYKLKLKKFYRKLVNDVLISRQEIIEQVLSSSHSDMPISLSWHERQMQRRSCSTGNLDNKYKKILKEVKDECEDNGISSDEEPSDLYPQPHCPVNGTIHSETCYLTGTRDFMTSSPIVTPTTSQQSVTEEDCQRMLQSHKRKRMNRGAYPELDTQMISLEDVISRTNVTGKKVSKTVVKKKIKGKDKKEHIRKLKKRRSSVPPPVVVEQPPSPVVPVVKDEQVEPVKVPDTVEEVKSLKSLEISSPCFFCLLRDIFLDLPDTTADLDQIERMVGEWQLSSSCAASPWSFKEPSWIELIPSALKFLAGSSAASSSPSFLPLVIFKQKVHQWKWIGTYRDKDSDLVPLCEQWFETKDQVVNNVQAPATTCTAPGISLRTDYVVGPSSNDEKSDYQNQERDRYENPHKPFIYRMHGFDSIVAPVKGVFTKESNLNKAREHSLLVSKRPPYVTILTLVRDAAARLPNGEGTRAEVCQLLKDSQYINPDATDGQVHTVVSGALDRLHYEKDPCVKYDNARKVWIYLHKTRSVEEFEKIHEASAAAARAKKQMSQKQKLIKQQQKAKETALLATHLSPSSSTVEGGDGISTIIAAASVVLPENVSMPKPKKPSKPKRPAASPKKSDKSKGKVKKESLELAGPSAFPPPQLMATVLPSFPPVHIKQEPPSLDYLEHQEQGLFHSPTSSAFARTSRLNSPYMVMAQPDNTLPSYNVKIESGYEKPTVGNGSTSSSSSSESESESDSSSGEDVITGHGSIIPEHQDASLRYGDPRVPFDNMSLFQGNPNGSESENTFGGY